MEALIALFKCIQNVGIAAICGICFIIIIIAIYLYVTKTTIADLEEIWEKIKRERNSRRF